MIRYTSETLGAVELTRLEDGAISRIEGLAAQPSFIHAVNIVSFAMKTDATTHELVIVMKEG